jgi:hypothetical protein
VDGGRKCGEGCAIVELVVFVVPLVTIVALVTFIGAHFLQVNTLCIGVEIA